MRRRIDRPRLRGAAAAAALAVMLCAPAARAQASEERVHIETDAGVVEGTIIDRLPDGYLLRTGSGTRVIPYASVKSLSKIDDTHAPSAAPPIAPPVAPPAAPPQPPSRSPVLELRAAPAPPPPRSPALVTAGQILFPIGLAGAGVGVVLLTYGLVSKKTCHAGDLTFDCEYGNSSGMVSGGIAALVVGGSMAISGKIMSTVGAMPRKGAPSVGVGPSGVTLRWTY